MSTVSMDRRTETNERLFNISSTRNNVASISRFNGRTLIHIRNFYDPQWKTRYGQDEDALLKPGAKGIALRKEEFLSIISRQSEILSEFDRVEAAATPPPPIANQPTGGYGASTSGGGNRGLPLDYTWLSPYKRNYVR